MFSKPRINVIESDEGFSAKVLDRLTVRHTAGQRTVVINAVVLVGEPAIAIHTSSMKRWGPPYDREVIDMAARDRIVDNIRRAFRFSGHEIAV